MDLLARLKPYDAGSNTHPGCQLMGRALAHLDHSLANLVRGGRIIHTSETGCGNSTILFSHYAQSHIVFCDVASASGTSALSYVKSHPDFRPDKVSFVVGPTPETLFAGPKLAKVDVLLLNGQQAYPIPDLEYFKLGRRLTSQGLLILNDIRVPTIKNLFDFLFQDERFRLQGIVDSTAFFESCSAILPTPNDWRDQRYNRMFYPAHKRGEYPIGYSLPFSIIFDGGQRLLPPLFRSGFALNRGSPVMEGHRATMSLPLDRRINGEIEVKLGIEASDSPADPSLSLAIHCGGSVSRLRLSNHERHSLAIRTHLSDTNRIHLTLIVSDIDQTNTERRRSGHTIDESLPAKIRITNIETRLLSEKPAMTQGQRLVRTDGTIAQFYIGDQEFRFFVSDPSDSIQAYHVVGQIYELEELALIAKHVKQGGRILDIGANIGNHAIWFEKSMGAARVVVIEPQSSVISLLKINCLLNDVRHIDQSFLGIAFGKEDGQGRIEIADARNVAGGRLIIDQKGPVRVACGDHVLGDQDFDFVKIDVEGAELDVLMGLVSLLDRCRPIVFVEVWDEGRENFLRGVKEFGYTCIEEFRRYPVCSNLLLKPIDDAARRHDG